MSYRNLTDTIVSDMSRRVIGRVGNSKDINYRFGSVVLCNARTAAVLLVGDTVPVSGVRVPSLNDIVPNSYVRVAMTTSGDYYITEVY